MSTTATAHLVTQDGTLHTTTATITSAGTITLAVDDLPNGTYTLSLVVYDVQVGDPE